MFDTIRKTIAAVIYPEGSDKRLKERNKDLKAELDAYLHGAVITDQQAKDIQRIGREHYTLNSEQNAIVVYIRDNFRQEMESGQFSGMSFSEMVIVLLKRPNYRMVPRS